MMGFMIGFFSLVIQDMYTKSIWFQYSLKKKKNNQPKKGLTHFPVANV